MSAHFEIKRAKNDQYYFRLLAGNGEVILTSEQYKVKASAKNGIASVQTNAKNDDRYERKNAKNGKPYFVLKAANHQIIGTSETYNSEQSMEKGIASVKTNAPKAKTSDLS